MNDWSAVTQLAEPPAVDNRRTIPFDHAFRFELKGVRDTKHVQTLTVSIEASFVAVSIGYGVVARIPRTPLNIKPEDMAGAPVAAMLAAPAAAAPLVVDPGTFQLTWIRRAVEREFKRTDRNLQRGALLGTILKSGIRLNPVYAQTVLDALETNRPLRAEIAANMFETVGVPPECVQFLYGLYDEATGREFQSEPILNTAGLGSADGDRPFRYFARPIEFSPRSTIRMEIIEKTSLEHATGPGNDRPIGDLHVVLHGYKVLGAAGSPTARVRRGLRR